jgi:hypothetical protein
VRHICILFLFCVYSITSVGKDYPMVHYGQKDGLPSNMVYDIYQDDDGYMWFATDKGVVKYNGLKFQRYTTNDGLSDNECFFFRKDYEGRLWIGTYNGTLMYYKDGVFHTAKNTPFLQLSIKDGLTADIQIEKDSSITLFFKNRSAIISILHNKVSSYSLQTINEYFGNVRLYDIQKTSTNSFDLYYPHNKLTIDTNCKISNNYYYSELLTLVTRELNQKFYIAGGNIYTNGFSLYQLLPKDFIQQHHINRVHAEQLHFFIATDHGLWIDNTCILQKHSISTIRKDREGNYWISTLDDGIYKMSRYFSLSNFMEHAYPVKVQHVAKIGNSLLFTTADRNTYQLSGDSTHCLLDFRKEVRQKSPAIHFNAQVLQGNRYWNMGEIDREPGYFCINGIETNSPRILRLVVCQQSQDLKFESYKYPIIHDVFFGRNYMYFSSSSMIQFISLHDLPLVNNQTIGSFKIFPNTDRFSSDRIYGITQSPDSTLWFSTSNKVYKIADTVPLVQSQFGNIVFKAMTFNKGYLIGTTMDNKLLVCNQYTDKHIYIDSTANNDCIWDKFYRINDSIILVTSNDYYRLITTHPSPGKPQYSIRIVENPFVPQLAEYIYSDNKTCYFFKDQSITQIPVNDLLQTPSAPRLLFTTIKAMDSSYKIDSFVHLSYNESRDININFTTFSFNTTAISYEYSISSRNSVGEWQKSNGENINLFKIGSGTYTICIRAKTFGGTYSRVQSFVLSIGKPFWFSWWFLSLCVLFLTIIGYIIVRYYVKRVAIKKESEMKFMKSEFTALNALMNPHFIFNTLNSVQSLINRDNKQEASEHIRTVADLIRQNMHNVSRDLITLENEITLVTNYLRLEQLRFPWLSYTINNTEDIDLEEIMVPPLMIQPLVENAIIHGLWPTEPDNGHIQIDIYNKPDWICIDIADNGRGFVSEEGRDSNHQSTALFNIRKRLAHLSEMHGRVFLFDIQEMKDGAGKVLGVKATICIGDKKV